MSEPTTSARKPGRTSKPVVYLVDDEKLLLDLAELALTDNNYVLKKFHDPAKALQAFLRAKVKPALLITDYAMGRMNGMQLIAQCKQNHPPLKTILISGTAGAEVVLGAPVQADCFLGKPYQSTSLAELAHSLLASGPGSGA